MSETPIEDLASQCLARVQAEGEQAIESICAEHPGEAERIRGMVRQLLRLGLVDEPAREVPEEIGDYRILRRVGGGGMGVVYLAEQTSLGRRVALKLMRPGFTLHGRAQERFRREVAAISRLDHPGICTVHEAGEADGMPYLAMRYIDGESLATVLARRREESSAKTTSSSASKLPDTLLLVERIARAVHAAHEAGLVHRDIKPANIMIEESGQPVVLDFGLAHADDPEQVSLTISGEQLGTPVYMAPEQVAGRPVDRRTDVHALGVTLYECLTLRPPFEATTRESLYRQILSADPMDSRSHKRRIGTELRVVLAKALDKEPARRFASALELAEELRRIRVHEPILTRRPSVLVRTLRWTQRNRTATGVLVATLVGLLASLWFLVRSETAAKRWLALAWLERAAEVEAREPELAFKLAREALRMNPGDPTIRARIQEIMFQLRDYETLLHVEGKQLTRALHSPGGRFLVVTGFGVQAALFDSKGRELLRVPYVSGMQFPPVAFHPEEKEVAFGVWNPERNRNEILRYGLEGRSPRQVTPAIRIPSEIASICYRADGLRLLVAHFKRGGSSDFSLFHLDGTLLKHVRRGGHPGWYTAGFLPNGKIVAGGRIWDADGENPRWLDGDFEGYVLDMAGIPVTRDRFLVSSQGGQIGVYDHDGNRLGGMSLPVPDARYLVLRAEFDPSGERILTSARRGWVRLLDRHANRVSKERFVGHTVHCARYSPDGSRIAVGDWNGTIHVWDPDLEDIDRIRGHRSSIGWLCWSPTTGDLVSLSWEGDARRWTLEPWPGVGMSIGKGWPSVAASPGGERVVAYSETYKRLALHDPAGRLLRTRQIPGPIRYVAFASDSEVVASPFGETRFHTWDLDTDVLQSHDAPNLLRSTPPLRVDGDEGWLLHMAPNRAYLWKPGEAGPTMLGESLGGISAAAVSSDGRRIALGAWNGKALLLDSRGEVLGKRPSTGMVASLRFSRDGRRVLISSDDNAAHVWSVESGEQRRYLDHQNGVLAAEFSPDERWIATSCKDGWVRVFDVSREQPVLRLRAHTKAAKSVAFTSDDRLASAGSDGKILWWILDAEKLRAAVEALEIGELSEEERRRVAGLLGR